MLILGCDPGFTGAIAFLDTATWYLGIFDMPVFKDAKGKQILNLTALATTLHPGLYQDDRNLAVIEKVHAMPSQGSSSTFRFGEGYGALQMGLAGHGYELRYVTPAAWKKHYGLTSDGNASRGLATQRFPKNADQFKRVMDHGRAEAALLALYGAEVLASKPP